MPRKLNRVNIEPGARCIHCDDPFERPYERVPEVEGTSGNVILKCQYCGLMTVFTEVRQ